MEYFSNFMTRDKITFLTNKDFDINSLIENLKKNLTQLKKSKIKKY